MTESEKRQSIAGMALSLPLVFGLPVLAAVWQELQPLEAFFHSAGMVVILGLFDLIVIDWLMFCFLRPSFIVLEGTDGAAEYGDYRHHATGFMRGLPLALIVGLAGALAGGLANG
ncbi:hypothetical protein A33O_15211 [Nitratireductor aquibiodomus RA22]|uniref:Uncharacterized protein n=1 Tax=Nitratireductor aquibiodomus RA22 TaxID=1189611 RepID=I5BVD5_9HYPH|nr:hypothetical protein [Nitratireductor aquibiodomus]EIM73537.1 hypothetical protein A33O_15211 [Nitratireductor aquibiodomus RA22]